ACGALDTPALLLRSGIGGPACGDHLRLHPATAIAGLYDEQQRGWGGGPQAALSMQVADVEDGYGFLIGTPHASPGVGASATPWASGENHKEQMSMNPVTAAFVFLIRDRGQGRITIDLDGNSVVNYDMTDELDMRIFRQAMGVLVQMHDA